MLNDKFKQELSELAQTPGELVLAVLLMSGVDIQTLDSWQRSVEQAFEMQPETGCAKVIANALYMDLASHIIGEMKRELKGEYPELYEYLEGVYVKFSDDLP